MSNEVAERNNDQFDTRSVVKKLEGLMDRVTSQDCTTDTVNAACNCASRITDILKLHLDVERLKMKRGGRLE